MATHGVSVNSNGDDFSWEVAAYGERDGDWHQGEPSRDELEAHIGDSDWSMVVKYEDAETGATNFFTMYGGYEYDDLDAAIDDIIGDY